METSAANSSRKIDEPRSRWHLWPVTVTVFASFFAHSALQTPVPGANEPHYLPKAKHYWDRSFARGDLFLESADAHPVFYFTIGALTRFLTLEQTVWTGRLLAYGLLAIGWTAMLSRVLSGRWSPLAIAWVYLGLTRLGDLPRTLNWPTTERYGSLQRFVLSISGEWLVGGLEAKIFAYGFIFWSLAMWWSGRHRWAAVLAGLAVSFHPIVGLWAIIAAVIASCLSCIPLLFSPGFRIEWRTLAERFAVPVVLLLIFAQPGLVPALQMLYNADPDIVAKANEIQVFQRLAHHLDPFRFSKAGYEIYAVLLAIWLIGRRWLAARGDERQFSRFVLIAVLFAAAGWVIGQFPRLENGDVTDAARGGLFHFRVSLMKFYPFRLCDVMVRIAVSVTGVGVAMRLCERLREKREERKKEGEQRTWLPRFLSWTAYCGVFVFALLSPSLNRDPSRMKLDKFRDWLAVCRWMKEESPQGAIVWTPNSDWAFKWYAHRAEYYSYKDCPQDAESILEWDDRNRLRAQWLAEVDKTFDEKTGYPADALRRALRALQRKTGITHFICHPDVQLGIAPVYPTGKQRNTHYAVYRLQDAFR